MSFWIFRNNPVTGYYFFVITVNPAYPPGKSNTIKKVITKTNNNRYWVITAKLKTDEEQKNIVSWVYKFDSEQYCSVVIVSVLKHEIGNVVSNTNVKRWFQMGCFTTNIQIRFPISEPHACQTVFSVFSRESSVNDSFVLKMVISERMFFLCEIKPIIRKFVGLVNVLALYILSALALDVSAINTSIHFLLTKLLLHDNRWLSLNTYTQGDTWCSTLPSPCPYLVRRIIKHISRWCLFVV